MRQAESRKPIRIPVRAYWQLLRQYLEPQRTVVLLMAVLLLTSIGLQLAGPRLLGAFINGITGGAPVSALYKLGLQFILLSFSAQGLRVLAGYWSERVAWTASNALRLNLAAHLLHLDAGFHQERTPGELIERIDGDVTVLAGFFSSFIVQLVGSLLLLIGILGALALVRLPLGLALTLYALLVTGLLNWVRRFGTPYHKEVRERSSFFYGFLGEVIEAREDLRTAGAVPYVFARFREHLKGWLPVELRATLGSNGVWVTAIVAFAVLDGIAYGMGGGLFRAGAVSMGTVYMVLAYTALLAAPLETVRNQLQDLQRADASIARVRELLAVQSRLVDGSVSLPGGPLSVAFEQVTFRYADGDNVLDNLSFCLKPGETLGVLGRTGSGKSTIARLLLRLYDPAAGAVRLAGQEIRDLSLQSLRSRVGFVTQEVQLFEASLRENITLFDPSVPDSRLAEVLNVLGMGSFLRRLPQGLDTLISPASLSAGEAQLIAFARVFLRDPGLVILDEASSRLDPATEAVLERAVRRLLEGRTAIIIAHRLATLERVDQVMILGDGRILEQGARGQLAADPASRFAALRRIGLEEVLA